MDGHPPGPQRTLSVEFEVDRHAQTRLKQAYHRIQTQNQVTRRSQTSEQTTVAMSLGDLVTSENQG